MLSKIHIENFKSIRALDFEPGRFNVLIGENGSGKSNLLEALTFAAAAASDKLDNEFLASRGLRVTDHRFMRSAFEPSVAAIRLSVEESSGWIAKLSAQSSGGATYPTWGVEPEIGLPPGVVPRQETIGRVLIERTTRGVFAKLEELIGENTNREVAFDLKRFLLFSPEATPLRTFAEEGQIVPLGVRGEGLFKLLGVIANAEERGPWNDLREALHVLDWFEDLEAPEAGSRERAVRVRDRFVPADLGAFDQRSTNEGFLFLLFYLALFVSKETPPAFGIDNIEASLNPKLCAELVRRLVQLAKKHGKQAVVTTHNPAILDGLDLHDDEQRLFVVARGKQGDTKVRRIAPPKPVAGELPVKLSDAFSRGLLGGLPKNF